MYTHKSVRNTREATMQECYERQHILRCDTAHTKQNAETPHTCRQLHSCWKPICPTVTLGTISELTRREACWATGIRSMCHCWAWTPAMEGPRGLLMDWQGYATAALQHELQNDLKSDHFT